MAQKLLGPSTIVQGAMAEIINGIPDSFHQRNIAVFEVLAVWLPWLRIIVIIAMYTMERSLH